MLGEFKSLNLDTEKVKVDKINSNRGCGQKKSSLKYQWESESRYLTLTLIENAVREQKAKQKRSSAQRSQKRTPTLKFSKKIPFHFKTWKSAGKDS
ncbi:hypothetical protein AVEN_8149-1 [Araneus ventricosus]|uniref:Uncharacterized protein n=1 Tax=Araneus ventricosus TaxID=182803 RepID=A0A4Y2SUT2_ARAVE|nr:hypothetical protein AVEN_8149-1 [Araneus ventricosus]